MTWVNRKNETGSSNSVLLRDRLALRHTHSEGQWNHCYKYTQQPVQIMQGRQTSEIALIEAVQLA